MELGANVIASISSVVITYITLATKDAISIRREMKKEIGILKKQIESIQSNLDLWKEKYNNLYIVNGKLTLRIKALKIQMDHIRDNLRGGHDFDNLKLEESIYDDDSDPQDSTDP